MVAVMGYVFDSVYNLHSPLLQHMFLISSSCRVPSLTRGRVCNLQCKHSTGPITIYYCLICDSPNLEGQVPMDRVAVLCSELHYHNAWLCDAPCDCYSCCQECGGTAAASNRRGQCRRLRVQGTSCPTHGVLYADSGHHSPLNGMHKGPSGSCTGTAGQVSVRGSSWTNNIWLYLIVQDCRSEVRVWFPALPHFLRNSGSGMGST
jgi:hypothetical protein